MPLEIKAKDGKKINAIAMVSNTSRCGVCDMVLLDDQTFFMLDDPYCCIVHERCMQFFEFDGKPRCNMSARKTEQQAQISLDEDIVGGYMTKPHFNKMVPKVVREAWIRMFILSLTLRATYDVNRKVGRKAKAALQFHTTTTTTTTKEAEEVEERADPSLLASLLASPDSAKSGDTSNARADVSSDALAAGGSNPVAAECATPTATPTVAEETGEA